MKLLIYISFLLGLSFMEHDVRMAKFNLSQSDDKLNLAIEVDKEDFENILFNDDKSEKNKKEISILIDNYISDNLSIIIGNKKIHFSISQTKIDEYYYLIHLETPWSNTQKIQKIEIKNTFLLHIEDQSNIFFFELNDNYRGFRMHEGRTEILVGY